MGCAVNRSRPWLGLVAAGLLAGGCEDGGDGGRAQLVSREVLVDGSLRTVYEEPTTTDTGAPAVRRTTIVAPPAGTPTTNVAVMPVSGMVNGTTTNATPEAVLPTFPGLPPGATPLPPPP